MQREEGQAREKMMAELGLVLLGEKPSEAKRTQRLIKLANRELKDWGAGGDDRQEGGWEMELRGR